MLSTIIALTGLLTTTLALPGFHHHHKGHKALKSGYPISGGPYPTGTGGPFSMPNGTVGALSTGFSTYILSSPILPTPDGGPDGAAPTVAVAAASALKDPVANEKVANGEDTCPTAVTVTSTPTITVTLTADAESADSSAPAVVPVPSSAATSAAPVVAYPKPKASASSVAASSAVSIAASEAPIPTTSSTAAVEAASTVASAPASTAPAAKATAVVPAAPGTKSKRGIISSGSDMNALVEAMSNQPIAWLGNWFSGPPTNLPDNIEFVPQNYGKASDTTGDWTKNAEKAVSQGDKYFLSFGEPNTPNAQLQMDASETVSLWMSKMEPYAKQGITIGAPGVLQNTGDLTFLSEFLDQCEAAGCNIGFIALHWFYVADVKNIPGFKSVVANATALAKGKPVWVDNFQATGSVEDQKAFFDEMLPWLDAQPQIERYAYVPLDRGTGNGFLNADGSLSELGSYYANL